MTWQHRSQQPWLSWSRVRSSSHCVTASLRHCVTTYEGWKSLSHTQSVCPSPVMMISPVGMAHIFHVQSSLVVDRICFRGCRATLKASMQHDWIKNTAVIYTYKILPSTDCYLIFYLSNYNFIWMY